MRGWLLLAALALLSVAAGRPGPALAAESAWPMQPMQPDLQDQASLQNGWRLFNNYCLGCHSLRFQRYERTADDLGVPHDAALENLVFTGQKIGDLMTTAMDPEQAKKWFGAAPPDLSMVTRVRSPEWLYNYLKTFYADDSRPFGVNNKVFENVGMPHALVELQGLQEDLCEPSATDCFRLAAAPGAGQLSPEEYDQAVYDLVNFLHYIGEPARLQRERIGPYVLAFLVILGIFTYFLNREFWKDIR